MSPATKGVIGDIAAGIHGMTQNVACVPVFMLILKMMSYMPHARANEMSANLSMAYAPALNYGGRNSGWAGLEGAASGWNKSAGSKWVDCGEYFSAGMLKLAGKTQL